MLGAEAGAQYYAGYIIEKSLSVDNVFVWAVLLGFFAVPKALQHRVLFWGVFGALILRAVFIFAGVALLNRLTWLVLVFGAFLVFTGVRVGTHDEGEVHPERNPILKLMRKRIPMTADYRGPKFFIREHGKRLATPLFAVLVMVELTDVVFAVDSIPAILAISRSQFIVFASNAFAILGLRALYFLLAGLQDKLVYLNKGLGVILVYVGLKMLASYWDVHINILLSLELHRAGAGGDGGAVAASLGSHRGRGRLRRRRSRRAPVTRRPGATPPPGEAAPGPSTTSMTATTTRRRDGGRADRDRDRWVRGREQGHGLVRRAGIRARRRGRRRARPTRRSTSSPRRRAPTSASCRSAAAARLHDDWCAPLAAAGVTYRSQLVEDLPVAALVSVATDEGADLIVIGSHGESGWRDRILGRTASGLPHDARRARSPSCRTTCRPEAAGEPAASRLDRRSAGPGRAP